MGQLVFDYHAGIPWVLNDAIEETMADAIEEQGRRVAADAISEEAVRQLRTNPDYREQFRQAYTEAGVNLTSVTMYASDPALSFAEGVDRALDRWQARFDAVDWLRKVTTPTQARDVADADDVGVILNVQNLGFAIEGDVDAVERLYNRGVRIMQLTYNEQNRIGTGCTDRSDGGLSYHGLDVIERMNDLGAVVDLSHCGKQTTLDGIEAAERPVAVTHSCCEAVFDHDRAKSDEEIKALAEADGYMGIVAVPFFLTDESDPSIDIFFDHLEHAVDILGVDRVGIGSDFSSIDVGYPEPLKEGAYEALEEVGFREEHNVVLGEGFGAFERYEDWSVLREGIEERFTEAEAAKLLGENFLKFWERAIED
ncbi:MAG: dipeptidase [Halobacteriales archaeon]